MTDKKLLFTIRCCVVGFAGLVLTYAFNSDRNIFSMVEDAYKVTLAGAVVPLAFGVYWKRANTAGAILSIILGIGTWISLEIIAPEGLWPPQLAGFLASVTGMLIGGFFGKPPIEHHHHEHHVADKPA